jgi:hypothetical protein
MEESERQIDTPARTTRYETAPTSIRVLAWLVDMVGLFFAVVVLAAVVDLVVGAISGSPYVVPSLLPVILVASLVYSIPLWRLRGATLGQALFKIYVYKAEEPVPLNWRHAAIRWLGPFGWMILAVASLQSGLWVNVMLLALILVAVSGQDPQRRFIHDRLSGSVVVQKLSITGRD